MSAPSIYTDGTISVSGGATTFAGSGTAWSTQLKRGTQIFAKLSVIGSSPEALEWVLIGVVASITSDTEGEFVATWDGDDISGAAYVAETWSDGGEIAEYVRTLMERLIGRGLGVVVSGTPVAADYQTNDQIWDRNSGLLYIKDQGQIKAITSPVNADAYGYVTSSPSDRDAHDDEDAGFVFFSISEGGFYVKLSSASADWSELVILRGAEPLVVGCSDEDTVLVAGAAKRTFRAPQAMAIAEVRASLTTEQTSGALVTVDVNKNGSSVLSTLLTIDNGSRTSVGAATPAVISDPDFADDDEVTIDLDQVGDGTAKGLKVTLIWAPAP